MNIKLDNVTDIKRIDRNQFDGTLNANCGPRKISFQRRLNGWEVELHIVVGERRWHTLELSRVGDGARSLWADLDTLADHAEDAAETSRALNRPHINAALFEL